MRWRRTNDWYNWAGYRAPHSLWDEELEYFAIRSQAALFDISPMTKYRIEGPDAEAFLNRVTLRDVAKLKPGRVHYTAWCDDDGFVLDDGTLFRLSPTRFRLCSPGAASALAARQRHRLRGRSSRKKPKPIAGLALQGPTSFAVLRDAGFAGVEQLKIFDLAEFPHDGGQRSRFRAPASPAISATNCSCRPRHGAQPLGSADAWPANCAAYAPSAIRALNRARLEAGLIVANADFVTAEHAIRADRLRMPDEIGLGFMIDLEKGHFNGRRAILEARGEEALRHVLVGLEIEGNIPAEHAIVYHRKSQEVGLVSAAMWSPMAKRNIAIASLARPFGDTIVDDLWVEIYAMRELQYQKLMKRAKVVPRPFIKLDRRTANPPADF